MARVLARCFIDMNKVVTLINEGEKNLKLQNHFSSILNVDQTVQFFKYHKDHSGAPDNARVHSCLGPLSGSWTTCVPKDPQSSMDNESTRLVFSLRLGIPITGASAWCSLCRTHIDKYAIHPFSCPHQRSRLLDKHDSFVRQFKILASLAGVNPKDRNLTLFNSISPNDLRRADLLLSGMGQGGRDLLIDFVFSDPRCASHCSQAALAHQQLCKKKAAFKRLKYLQACHRAGYSFLPGSMEIFGTAIDELFELIKALVEKASSRSHIPFHTLLPYWIKRLSMTIQKGNAKHWFSASVRMNGGPRILQDPSLSLDTHH
jgi:hypothetical protein